MSPLSPPPPVVRRFLPPLALRRNQSICLFGAATGLLIFLFTGLLPSLLLGGSAGAQLARGLLDLQEAPGFGLNTLMVVGVVSAATIGAAFFTLLGAAAGAAVGELSRAPLTPKVAP